MTRTEGSGVLLWWQMPNERRGRQTKEEMQSSAQYREQKLPLRGDGADAQ